jgi:hypothetical protein
VHLFADIVFVVGRHKKPDSEKVKKPGVSLTPECREILASIIKFELEANHSDMTQSQAIRKCMRLAWDHHYKACIERFENPQPAAPARMEIKEKRSKNTPLTGRKITNPRKTFSGGSDTAKTKSYPMAG